MPRYRITIEYDGSPFVGWQSQAYGASVQDTLEAAIRATTGEAIRTRAAGRTDAGVHALGQVAHFDLARTWDPFRLREALNQHVRPRPVAVIDCAEVPTTFDARFSALRRHYLYRILNRRAPPALSKNRVWWVPHALDAAQMAEAARVLVGHHDFTTFRATACQAASPVKTLDRFDVSQRGDEIAFEVAARSFLHNQVRSMVGTLKLVGAGRWAVADVQRALLAKDRTACGLVAPPDGLYLTKVDYADGAAASVAADDGGTPPQT
ncbi:MAG: tRNA pseudouridine(38-40) synthase TruA [Hyphomicrobiaceae bacterium]|nr:tRNA pseudouridine(38-40) synthase TruA [Hyphomicrobiaceae bacterium]